MRMGSHSCGVSLLGCGCRIRNRAGFFVTRLLCFWWVGGELGEGGGSLS